MFCVMLDYFGKSNKIESSMKTSSTVEYLDLLTCKYFYSCNIIRNQSFEKFSKPLGDQIKDLICINIPSF